MRGKVRPMRALCLALALVLPLSALADRLIFIPTATKLNYGSYRLEHVFDQRGGANSQTYLGLGVGLAFDMAVTSGDIQGGDDVSVDFAFHVLDPIVNLAPGFSVGVVDAMDRTADGRRMYIATTYRSGLDGPFNAFTPAEVTLGVFMGSRNAMFVGVQLPFSDALRVLVEHDSNRLAAGFEVRPFKAMSLRWVQREDRQVWSLGYRGRL